MKNKKSQDLKLHPINSIFFRSIVGIIVLGILFASLSNIYMFNMNKKMTEDDVSTLIQVQNTNYSEKLSNYFNGDIFSVVSNISTEFKDNDIYNPDGTLKPGSEILISEILQNPNNYSSGSFAPVIFTYLDKDFEYHAPAYLNDISDSIYASNIQRYLEEQNSDTYNFKDMMNEINELVGTGYYEEKLENSYSGNNSYVENFNEALLEIGNDTNSKSNNPSWHINYLKSIFTKVELNHKPYYSITYPISMNMELNNTDNNNSGYITGLIEINNDFFLSKLNQKVADSKNLIIDQYTNDNNLRDENTNDDRVMAFTIMDNKYVILSSSENYDIKKEVQDEVIINKLNDFNKYFDNNDKNFTDLDTINLFGHEYYLRGSITMGNSANNINNNDIDLAYGSNMYSIILISVDMVMADTNDLVLSLTTLSILCFIIIIFITIIYFSFEFNQIKKTAIALKDISSSSGDLTKRIDLKGPNEAKRVAYYFNLFMDRMQKIIANTITVVNVLDKSSNDLLLFTDEVSNTTKNSTNSLISTEKEIELQNKTLESINKESLKSNNNLNTLAIAIEEISASVSQTAASTTQLSSGLTEVNTVVEDISKSLENVSQSSKLIDSSVSSVSNAISELDRSLNEVNVVSQNTMIISTEAEKKSLQTLKIMETLSGISKEVGKIVNIINDIAERTNMLALNASIEAAGAGEAGRGFSIVANEVKDLANQTSSATDEIKIQITEMLNEVSIAYSSVNDISNIISEINQANNTIAASVAEQSAVATEITSETTITSSRINLIAKEISEVSSSYERSSESLNEMSKGIYSIADSTSQMSKTVSESSTKATLMSESFNDITIAITELSQTTTEVMTNVRSVVGEARLNTEKNDETVEIVSKIKELSDELYEKVKNFKI